MSSIFCVLFALFTQKKVFYLAHTAASILTGEALIFSSATVIRKI